MEEREVMNVDVLFVGGGMASLSGALHLSNLIRRHNEKVDAEGQGKKLEEVMIAVIEKGAFVGAHGISGAVMNPVALKELVPDFIEKGAPLEGEVEERTGLPAYQGRPHQGSYHPSAPEQPRALCGFPGPADRVARQTGGRGRRLHVSGFAGTEVLYQDDRVIGVRTGDKGIDADGSKKSNFEPGIDLHAKVTVFGEGSRGSLTKTLLKKFKLDEGKNPQGYVVGVKEVWEVPGGRIQPGDVIHTMGYPLKSNTYGGGFIYGMKDNKLSIGLLTGLEYADPFMDPHREFQRLKQHPYIAGLLKDGKMIQYGAKTAPVGGYFSVPKLTFPGGLLIGDSASLFISMKLKGIHAAMKSGMLAAETIFASMVKDDFSEKALEAYPKALLESSVGRELYLSRNFHQAFQKGLWVALVKAGLQFVLGGRIWKAKLETGPDHTHLKSVSALYGKESLADAEKGDIKYDGKCTFDKETDVYYSGTTHEEKQPPHLKILDLETCYNRCTKEFQNPCVRFCPAHVYEMEVDEQTGQRKMKLNFSNCVHCKTCDVKDPYENINWVPPEGGGGPKYTVL